MQFPQINTFPYPAFYLDAICGKGNWTMVISRAKDGSMRGVLPYQQTKKWGLPVILPPALSPRLGPWLFYPKHIKTLQQKNDFQQLVLTDLVKQLPFFCYARIQWPYKLNDGTPWQKLGWKQTIRHSYQLDLKQDNKLIFKQFKPSLRNKINKAKKHLQVISTDNTDALLELMKIAAQHRNQAVPVAEKVVQRVVESSLAHEKGKLWIAKTAAGKTVGAHFLFWDQHTAYNLFLESHPDFRSLGVAPYLLWKSILFAKEKGLKIYDFEGSHLPGVATFFRSFGASPKPYFRFTKSVVGII